MNCFMWLGRKAHSWEQLGKCFVRGSPAEGLLVALFAGVLLGYISHLQYALLLLLHFLYILFLLYLKELFSLNPDEMLRILNLVV